MKIGEALYVSLIEALPNSIQEAHCLPHDLRSQNKGIDDLRA
jgi:hypothetical protein